MTLLIVSCRISEDVGELREASSLYEEFIQGQLDEGVHFKVVETLRYVGGVLLNSDPGF